MNYLLDLKLLLLLAIANGTPVLAKDILNSRWAHPLDCGLTLFDGRRLLGQSKTFRGFFLSLFLTTIIGVVLGIAWPIASLFAAGAMAGDLLSSFIKRRTGVPAGGMATGIDQIPESLLPLLLCWKALGLSWLDMTAVVACFFAGEVWLSPLLFYLHLRDTPY